MLGTVRPRPLISVSRACHGLGSIAQQTERVAHSGIGGEREREREREREERERERARERESERARERESERARETERQRDRESVNIPTRTLTHRHQDPPKSRERLLHKSILSHAFVMPKQSPTDCT